MTDNQQEALRRTGPCSDDIQQVVYFVVDLHIARLEMPGKDIGEQQLLPRQPDVQIFAGDTLSLPFYCDARAIRMAHATNEALLAWEPTVADAPNTYGRL